MFLAILGYFRFGKGGVPTNPEKPEPWPIALHPRLDELQSAIGRMDVARSQLGPQTVRSTSISLWRIIQVSL